MYTRTRTHSLTHSLKYTHIPEHAQLIFAQHMTMHIRTQYTCSSRCYTHIHSRAHIYTRAIHIYTRAIHIYTRAIQIYARAHTHSSFTQKTHTHTHAHRYTHTHTHTHTYTHRARDENPKTESTNRSPFPPQTSNRRRNLTVAHPQTRPRATQKQASLMKPMGNTPQTQTRIDRHLSHTRRTGPPHRPMELVEYKRTLICTGPPRNRTCIDLSRNHRGRGCMVTLLYTSLVWIQVCAPWLYTRTHVCKSGPDYQIFCYVCVTI